MKQKIVIKVQVNCDKCRSKALTVAASTDGVISVSIEGTDRDQVVVIGEGVDAACLTRTLRKKVCYARLDTVEEVKDKPKDAADKPKVDEKEKNPPPCTWINKPPCYQNQAGMYTVVYDDPYRSPCTIM